jgi:steroid delta-isomerase-like uncharacterized protein
VADYQIDSALQATRHEIVDRHMTHENAHEFDDAIGAFHHPRYEIVATGEVWDGADGVDALLQENKTGFSDFKFHPTKWHHAEDAIIVEGNFTGTHDGSWRGLPATFRTVDFELIIVFKFEDDRMVCERTYFDIGTALRQLGVARDPNTLGGKIELMAAHPVHVGRALARQLVSRRRGGSDAPAG